MEKLNNNKSHTYATSHHDSKPCAVKLERIRSPKNVRRNASANSSPQMAKKMKTATAASVDKKPFLPLAGKLPAVKFGNLRASQEHVVNVLRNDSAKIEVDKACFIPNSVQKSSSQLLEACEALGTNDGNISTSIYQENNPKVGLSFPFPQDPPATPLSKEELLPPTASVYIHKKEELFSPHLLDFCFKHPIVLVRNLAPACNLDLQLFTTKTLVEMHPNHPVRLHRRKLSPQGTVTSNRFFKKLDHICDSNHEVIPHKLHE